ncbi:P60-like protein [Hygrophoropsis aurantiaca]|uniref:P60-like protein n=1 Tax=Hygrophoropsis aurantiaca TaxID=72124 RepID=A0ACB8AEA3_9AGAM|nr:P60-like protein [Hygrophoropsis aurantiaca]
MALSSSSSKGPKSSHSSLGAPSQHKQSSRKGKRAWRKNIDIQPVEDGLEGLRAEERVIGSILQKQTDDQLFQIDVHGDDKVRKSLPRYTKDQLTATKILNQRSAVPAVFSRPTGTTKHNAGVKINQADKQRLLRMAKRPVKGPFNTILDPTKFGAGSAIIDVSNAVKNSGGYDAWAPIVGEEVKDGLETVKKATVKKPEFEHPRDLIEIPAISEPHQGASYNPPASDHEELIRKAYEVEQRRVQKAEQFAEVKRQLAQARTLDTNDEINGIPPGMTLDEVTAGEENSEYLDGADAILPKKLPARKTKQQHAKAAKLRAEKQSLAERAAKKRMLASISTIKSLRSEVAKSQQSRDHARLARQQVLRARLKNGLAGTKLGKYKIPEVDIDVQIGEDLSESLRTLKPEGNLFRDRFLSLQQRALIEPRVPVLPTKRKRRMKEYEKHAWKRFE